MRGIISLIGTAPSLYHATVNITVRKYNTVRNNVSITASAETYTNSSSLQIYLIQESSLVLAMHFFYITTIGFGTVLTLVHAILLNNTVYRELTTRAGRRLF